MLKTFISSLLFSIISSITFNVLLFNRTFTDSNFEQLAYVIAMSANGISILMFSVILVLIDKE